MISPQSQMKIQNSILETIGDTPLVRLNAVSVDLPGEILAKVEFFNPGGSVKDRIGMPIIEEAEKSGRLKPGGTIVEATSGNTGVGLAIAAAIKGYKTIFVMPDKMSQEKILLLRSYGARVVVTPTAVEPEDPRSYYKVSERLVQETPNAILANQYHNPVNPQAHFEATGPEIWEQTAGRVTHFVAGMGTGGTITGTGRYLKEKNPHIKIIGVDPVGSILYDLHRGKDGKAESYKVEGIGEDFLPTATDLSVVDAIVQVSDRESFLMARRLVREEGMFVGGSCGSAVAGGLKYARSNNFSVDDVMVIILPDSGSRYLSKFLDDEWMRENGFLERAWMDSRARDIHLSKQDQAIITVQPVDLMTEVIQLFKRHNISQAPVVNGKQELIGMVREVDLLNHLLLSDHKHSADETIEPLIDTTITVIRPNAPLETLMGIFSSADVAVIVGDDGLEGILTKIDILDYLSSQVS